MLIAEREGGGRERGRNLQPEMSDDEAVERKRKAAQAGEEANKVRE